MRVLIIICEIVIHILALKTILGIRFPWEGTKSMLNKN